ncbi:hypothetical protein [Psychrobacter sp.]|uniref:hypothetical protein n=1 Tax=Psychrobacter sp. TaxID=56811 RepID=UPI0035629790
MKCGIDGCDNQTFKGLNKCALHCEKERIHEDSRSTVLSEFNRLLNLYILDDVLLRYIPDSEDERYINEIEKYRKNNKCLYDSMIFKEKFCEYKIGFHGILFPSTSLIDYTETLMIFENIWFNKCVFYVKFFNLKSTGVFFEECVFKYDIYIKPATLFLLKENYIFYQCVFEDKVYIGREGRYKYIFGESLFSGCVFENSIKFRNAILKKEPFLGIDERELKLSTLEIYDCNFDGGFKLNSTHISYLWIENTNFLIGFWMLKANITTLNCINAVIDGLFDASNSSFVRAKFNRTKFLDVADFEEVKFGKTNAEFLNSGEDTTQFKYVTFMNAANFKNTSFSYGLDFENVDLREQPNFLKSNINPHDTNRETFRIIKYSFDSRGNKIEAGKYHAYEMNAYINELSFSKNFWQLVILHANNLISRFGQSYIIPFALLVGSVSLYSYLLNSYKKSLQFRTYELSYGVECITEWLNTIARNFLPFARFISDKRGFEFVSLFFYIIFAILIWQIIVAVKKQTQH